MKTSVQRLLALAASVLGVSLITACNSHWMSPAGLSTRQPFPSPAAYLPTVEVPPGTVVYGGVIAFTSIAGNECDIYAMSATCLSVADPQVCRSIAVPLTYGPGASFQPKWSSDGRLVAFLYYDAGADRVDIWVAKADGTEVRPLTRSGVAVRSRLRWSPDGRYLVYGGPQADGPEQDVYRIDVLTGEIRNLTADAPGWDAAPDWSPDGQWIAFVSDRMNGANSRLLDDIWIMRPDGSGAVDLTYSLDWEDAAPAWSPDGAHIAFQRWSAQATDNPPGGRGGLWVVNVAEALASGAGGGQRLVVEFTDWSMEYPPVWSPDGQYIAFVYGQTNNDLEVWVVPVAGGQAVNVSRMPGDDGAVSWAPDSKSLLFTHVGEQGLSLYLAAPDGTGTRAAIAGGAGLADWRP